MDDNTLSHHLKPASKGGTSEKSHPSVALKNLSLKNKTQRKTMEKTNKSNVIREMSESSDFNL